MPVNKHDLSYIWEMRTATQEILVERVWLTATTDLPKLLNLLEQIVPYREE